MPKPKAARKRKPHPRQRNTSGQQKPEYLPTPEEIAAECARIRARSYPVMPAPRVRRRPM